MKNISLYKVNKEYIGFDNALDVINIADKLYVLKDEQVWCYMKLEKTNIKLGKCTNIVTSFHHLTIDEAVYFSTSQSVVFINTNNDEISMFDFETVITSTAWNPSQDILTIVFEDGNIGLFTFNLKEKTFDIKESSNLSFVCPETITIGWGSTKTQFRGPLKKRTDDVLTLISNVLINDEKEIEPVSKHDNKRPVITWRSDGEMFCVNFWNNDRRIIKFFNSECQPMFENSGVNGLQPILAWRPFGAGIASISVIKNNSFLVLFEKNATVRHEFQLEHSFYVKDLKWDQTGNLLSAYLDIPEENSSQIRIYMIKNNHLYLKQTLAFNTSNIINFQWYEGTSFKYALSVTVPNYYLKYQFKLIVNKMYVNDSNCTITGVVDGHILHLCRYTQSDCSSYKDINSQEPINCIIFYESSRYLLIFGIHNLYLYKYEDIQENSNLIGKISLISDKSFLNFFNFTTPYNTYKCIFNGITTDTTDDVKKFEINFLNFNTKKLSEIADLQTEITDDIELQENAKEVYSELIKTDKSTFKLIMDEYRSVYLNSKLMWNNITSYTIHQNYLFLTTKDTLIGIRLNTLDDFYLEKVTIPYTRTIEMGSSLICGMGSTSNLILQAPRGNIEIISCLLINIDNIDNFLRNNNWQEAWDTVRLLKLNSNLLFDLNPERFLKNIQSFIEACVLNVFLSELEEDNVLTKVYTTSGFKLEKFSKKVETVCSAIIDFLVTNNYVESLTSIVHACLVMRNSSVAPIKEALKHVQILFRYNTQNETFKKSIEDAIKFMLKYVHINDAYHAALSLYDLELAILIARHSEMDPKEYIYFITKLKGMSEMERKFTINDHLGNYRMAILYLYEEFVNNGCKRVVEYMNKHNLQKTLYDNISEKSSIYVDVVESYADKLISQKLYDEAGLILEKANLYDRALQSYKEAKNWKKSVEIMKNCNIDEISFKRNIREIAENLISVNQTIDASYLYETYLRNYETATKFLSEKHHFSLACEMARKYSRLDIIETTIVPLLKEFTSNMNTELEKLEVDYTKYKERLFKIRKEKIERLKHDHENKDFEYQENYQTNRGIEDDLYSLAGSTTSTKHGSSTASNLSRSSASSSRSKRKEQRKKEDLREGGQYEDIAIMKTLHDKISAVCNYGSTVREVCMVLFELNFESDARKLHNSLFDLQNKMKNDIKEIWPDILLKQDDLNSYDVKVLQQNLFSLDVMYWKPPVIKTDWVIHILQNC
ncbi:elongator complex protein 1 isoform X2 [Agrilus planipennis]|uniref:Elongator complex protein 1 n=1 Tax=Agrilus planipennis TaxID=224129 RepID=A0A1W4XBK6_AGRPL|nr:elongator complex protein 1 isoform X2 [Agrilus planipennis]